MNYISSSTLLQPSRSAAATSRTLKKLPEFGGVSRELDVIYEEDRARRQFWLHHLAPAVIFNT